MLFSLLRLLLFVCFFQGYNLPQGGNHDPHVPLARLLGKDGRRIAEGLVGEVKGAIVHGDGHPRLHFLGGGEGIIRGDVVGLHEPAGLVSAYTQEGVIGHAEKFGNFRKVVGIAGVAAIINGDAVPLQHEGSPKPLPAIVQGTLAPMLCREKGDFQLPVIELLVPARFNDFHRGTPTFYQLPYPQATKQFHPWIVGMQEHDARLVEVVEMVVADEQVVNVLEHSGVCGEAALPPDKRDVPENGVEHDAPTSQLHEKGVMPQPDEHIAANCLQTMQGHHPGVPILPALFLTLGIGGKTPFHDVADAVLRFVAAIDKASPHHRVSPPMGFDSNQPFISPESYSFAHRSKSNLLYHFLRL